MEAELESLPVVPGQRILFTVRETAELLSLSRSRVYELVASGRLSSVKIGRSRRVSIASIERLAAGSAPNE